MFVLGFALAASCGRTRSESNRVLDPANELPWGHVDTPTAGQQVPPSLIVGGWALDDRGVREVRLYIDNHIANTSPINTPRPDVSKAFAQYAHNTDLHGWTMSVDFDAPGPHTLIAQAVDTDGATRDIAVIQVTSTDK